MVPSVKEEISLFDFLNFNICLMKFHPFLTKLWLAMESKGNNSAITEDIPIKLHVHNLTMVMHLTKVLIGHVLNSLFLAKR